MFFGLILSLRVNICFDLLLLLLLYDGFMAVTQCQKIILLTK